MLGRQPGDHELATFLSAWWVDFSDRPAILVQRTDQVRRASIRLAVELDALLTPAQRQRFVHRVAALREDLEGVTGFSRQAAVGKMGQACG